MYPYIIKKKTRTKVYGNKINRSLLPLAWIGKDVNRLEVRSVDPGKYPGSSQDLTSGPPDHY